MEFIETLNHKYHLQGITSDGEYMYWSCTDTILKTTIGGSPRVQVEIAGGHLGDCDYYDGKLWRQWARRTQASLIEKRLRLRMDLRATQVPSRRT